MTTEVWISTRGRISEATRIAIQDALEEDNKKDTPSFGREDLEVIHRVGTETGLLGIYNFPGSVYATDGSNDMGVMGAGFFKLCLQCYDCSLGYGSTSSKCAVLDTRRRLPRLGDFLFSFAFHAHCFHRCIRMLSKSVCFRTSIPSTLHRYILRERG